MLVFYLIFGACLFCIGLLGVFFRKHIIHLLMSLELMVLGISTTLMAFSTFLQQVSGQILVMFLMAVSAAEAAVGLAILVSIFRGTGIVHVRSLEQLKQ